MSLGPRPGATVAREVLATAARRLRARLATWSGRDVPIAVGAEHACTLAEFVGEAAPGGLWARSGPAGGAAPVLFVVERALLSGLIGWLFGAEDAVDGRSACEGPTEVERAVAARLCRELGAALRDAWVGGPAPALDADLVAPSPRVCDDVEGATAYLVLPLEIRDAPRPARVHVALPVATAPGAPRPAPIPAPRVPRLGRLLPLEVELVVELARITLPLRRLETLTLGDELPLVCGATVARVADRPVVEGEPGHRGGARSIRVTRRFADSSPAPDDRSRE